MNHNTFRPNFPRPLRFEFRRWHDKRDKTLYDYLFLACKSSAEKGASPLVHIPVNILCEELGYKRTGLRSAIKQLIRRGILHKEQHDDKIFYCVEEGQTEGGVK